MIKMIMELVRNRRFTLTTGDSKQSRLRRLKNGVPQGSILAPLLFNIYIYKYDLSSMISRKFAYADDLALLHSFGNWKDLEGTLSQDMSTPQPTMLCRAHASPTRAARTGPVPIWPRALQWPRMGVPHEFHNIQTLHSNCSFFKIIKQVSLFACFNF